MACDRQVTWDCTTFVTTKYRKIKIPGLGVCIVCMSGYAYGIDMIHEQLAEHSKGCGQDIGSMSRESRYGFVVTKDLHVHGVYGDGRVGPREHHENGFFAEGGALAFLIGAMAFGATAEQAVNLACEHCNGCGYGVDVINVKEFLAYDNL